MPPSAAAVPCIPHSRPCEHNRWSKQTKKRGKLVLKCEVCGAKWKIDTSQFTKCRDFRKGQCSLGDNCEHPHIYAREEYLQTMRRRDQLAVEKKKRKMGIPSPLGTSGTATPPEMQQADDCISIESPEQSIDIDAPTTPEWGTWFRHDPYSMGAVKYQQ